MSEDKNGTGSPTVLQMAWQRFADLDANAGDAQKWHLTLRVWVIILSVVATLLAIVTQLVVTAYTEEATVARVLNFILISVPIIGSVLLAFANKLRLGERWLALRAGAEEIRKYIFLYRTVWSKNPDRAGQLRQEVRNIQLRVFESVEGNFVLKPYQGKIPPDEGQTVTFWAALIHLHLLWPKIKELLNQKNETENGNPPKTFQDTGFDDLTAAEYLGCRLEHQLNFHAGKMVSFEKNRNLLLALIFIAGGAGTILAAVGLNIWVALTASLAAAFTAWQELRRYEEVTKNYSKVVLELTSIRDDWLLLDQSQQADPKYFDMLVEDTEEVLWSQHQQYIATMRQALAKLKTQEADLTTQSAEEDAAPATQTTPKETIPAESTGQAKKEVSEKIDNKESQATPAEIDEPIPTAEPGKGAPHAFVVMPFGQKKGLDGQIIDFNSIYRDLIKPALIKAGFEPFRADEETVSGDILTDMFQELLLADLVIADLSIDNANAFYELGVRHALRKRGIVHIQSGRAYMPFDVFNVRTIPYHTGEDGRPDPNYLAKDIDIIAEVAYATWMSDRERVHSPIFNLLNGLPEPDRKALQTPLATGYWRKYRTWRERMQIARRQELIGDILLLTEEVPNPIFQEEAIAEAGRALRSIGNNALALQQYQQGLEINPKNVEFRREEGFHLGRLKRADEAIVKLESLLKDNPKDSETIAYLGRSYKDMWQNEWIGIDNESDRVRAASEADYLLKRSIEAYLKGYSLDQNHYYSGINALMLSTVLDYLATQNEAGNDRDPELEAIRQKLPSLTGAVQFGLEQAMQKDPADFWAFASQGDLAVCTAQNPAVVSRAYKKALALSGKSKFSLQSTLAQLKILDTLAFRPDYTKAGIDILQKELDKFEQQRQVGGGRSELDPEHVFLFAGHMIDAPIRPEARFPLEMEEEARQRIEAALDERQANNKDLAITPGIACGGDTLFVEGCLKRGMKVDVYLPFEEARFIEKSVRFAGNSWVERFYKIRQNKDVTIHLQPERVGPAPEGDSVFERNVRWALYSTLGYGIERVRLIVLWDGKGGDGPGGTGHMVKEVHKLGGIVDHLDTTKFDYWRKKIEA